MKISDLRNVTQMSQKEFAEHFGIPVGTLRNWEQGIASPPQYVISMIFTSMRRDKMINIETIRFVRMLDELSELTKNGILPFEEANENNYIDRLFYDTNAIEGDGYRIVLDARVIDDTQNYHHDVISYYDSDSFEYKIRAIVSEEDIYIKVTLLVSEDFIIIENGHWYFA